MKSKEDFGIYIHFPFCKRKCVYCDFYSVGVQLADWSRFAQAVENEFKETKIAGSPFISLYMGGGTPSLVPVEVIKRFRDMIPYKVGEFTLEVNPDDVTEEKARGWREAGVNRISMGIQTLNDEELKLIGRRHSASDAIKAYNILQKYFTNISIDLIFGLPGQTLKTLGATLDSFIGMRPQHISAYSLMYEERSVLTKLRDMGKVEETPEEDSVEMFHLITNRLREAGYQRYEISNYSLSGFRSHHNSNYWKEIPYLGLGPSAHSYDGHNRRRVNIADLPLYIKRYYQPDKSEDRAVVSEIEILTEDELREEMILTRLRTIEGLNLEDYKARFGLGAYSRLKKKAQRYLESGDLIFKEGSISITDSGVMISDEIIVDLF